MHDFTDTVPVAPPQAAPRIPRRRDIEPASGILLCVVAGLALWEALIIVALLLWPTP